MNANLLIGLIVGGVVVVGGGYYLYTNSSSTNDAPAQALVAQQEENTANPISGTLASLLGSGQALKCTFSYENEESSTSGIVYIADGSKRISGDFMVEHSATGPMEAHMVRDGGYNYVWGSFYPQGVKIAVSLEDEGKLFTSSEDMSIDDDTTYDCTPWNVDASKFVLPSDVEFMDMGMQMEAMMQMQGTTNTDVKAQQCAACAQVPAGSMRDQCLQALQCV